jgi:hypothetical protein
MLTSPSIPKTKIFTKYLCEKTTFYLVAVFQVLTNPPLLFCDEPTSGLDSFMSASVMELMREMAKQVHNEQRQERRHLGFFSSHNGNILWMWTKKIPEGMFSTGYFLSKSNVAKSKNLFFLKRRPLKISCAGTVSDLHHPPAVLPDLRQV